VLLTLSFPRYGHPAAAWIALAPLLVALSGWTGRAGPMRGRTPLRAFGLGMATGVVYFVGTCYWTISVLATFGGLPMALALLAMVLMAGYLSLYVAGTAVVISALVRRGGAVALAVAPLAWTGGEFIRGTILSGFPWVLLGSSQVTVLPVAQLASLTGVYGVTALVAAVNAALAYALVGDVRRRTPLLVGGAAALLAVGVWGTMRVADGSLTREGTPIRVGVIQGNVEQGQKWDPKFARQIFTTYISMTREAVRKGAQYVIWPESSTPFMFEEDPAGAAVRDLAAEVGTPILFGSDQIERGEMPRQYNAAFLVTPDRATAAVYRKMHLVPFGEFIPWKTWLTFASPLVESLMDFSAGDRVEMLPVLGHRTSTAICYEVVFPSLAREAVANGSELLTTITNDAWYGRTSAPYQHFALASMRAIEQGRYLVRSANTGISGVVDPYGRVVQASGVFTQVALVEEARFLTGRTVYSRVGDVVAYGALAVTALAFFVLKRS
jgi:apolipoprotein N-acyltransferase